MNDNKTSITLKKCSRFKINDRVWSEDHGLGTIRWTGNSYPYLIGVKFDNEAPTLGAEWFLKYLLYDASDVTKDTKTIRLLFKI